MLENYRCSWSSTLFLIKSGSYLLTSCSSIKVFFLCGWSVQRQSCSSIVSVDAPAVNFFFLPQHADITPTGIPLVLGVYTSYYQIHVTPLSSLGGFRIPRCRTLNYSFACLKITVHPYSLYTAPSPSVNILRTSPNMMANSATIVIFSVFIIKLSKLDGLSKVCYTTFSMSNSALETFFNITYDTAFKSRTAKASALAPFVAASATASLASMESIIAVSNARPADPPDASVLWSITSSAIFSAAFKDSATALSAAFNSSTTNVFF